MASTDLDRADAVTTDENGLLALLWRRVVKGGGFSNSLNTLVDVYLNKYDSTNANNPAYENRKRKTKSTMIGNITATGMTFKTFLDLVMNLLRAKKVKISVEITTLDDRVLGPFSVTACPSAPEEKPQEVNNDPRNGSSIQSSKDKQSSVHKSRTAPRK